MHVCSKNLDEIGSSKESVLLTQSIEIKLASRF